MNTDTINADEELNGFGYTQKLFRTLKIWQLVSFGLSYLQPIGPAVVFGFLLTTSQGTVALPYLFAFIGMIFTVLSYSTLIKEYPLSGSIYNYTKIILGPFWGFIAGWLLALDYVLIPTITSSAAALYAHQLIHGVSYEAWLFIFVLSMGFLNLIGIKSSTFFSSAILLIQIVVVFFGFAIWTRFIIHSTHSFHSLFSLAPFHFQSMKNVIQASALAIFSFLGFDAVTTLAEESINPKKDIPRAMLICTCIGFLIMFVTGYLGVLALPNWNQFTTNDSWSNSVLFNLVKTTGGNIFSIIYTLGFILAMATCNLVGTTSVTRLLYSMGRDEVIPPHIFGTVNKRWKTPHGNIIFIIVLELILGSLANIDQLAELINYGAITGFIFLNFSVIVMGHKLQFKQNKSVINFYLCPFIALIIMLAIWCNMRATTFILGSIWGVIGIIYYCILEAFL